MWGICQFYATWILNIVGMIHFLDTLVIRVALKKITKLLEWKPQFEGKTWHFAPKHCFITIIFHGLFNPIVPSTIYKWADILQKIE